MLTVGIIGAGGIAAAHISGYLEFPQQCRIVALCDIDPARAEARKAEFGLTEATVFTTTTEMLAAIDLDVVSITTPPSAHASTTIEALDAGVNVLVEKPMAPSLEECDAMIAAQEASGKQLGVVAQNRFRDDMVTLKEVLDSGKAGRICHAQVLSAWSRSLPYYDLWWRGTWASEGGGCTLNHAIHHLDLALWLVGRPQSVTSVLANTRHENAEVEDLSVAVLSYERALAEVTSSVVHHGEDQQIVLQCERARISQPWKAVADTFAPNGFPDGSDDALVADLDALAAAHEPLPHTGHTAQVGDFLAAVRDGRDPAVTAQDGRAAIELVTAIYQAGIERRTIDFPLAPDNPYYRSGTVIERAPHFFEKRASVHEQAGAIVVGASHQDGEGR